MTRLIGNRFYLLRSGRLRKRRLPVTVLLLLLVAFQSLSGAHTHDGEPTQQKDCFLYQQHDSDAPLALAACRLPDDALSDALLPCAESDRCDRLPLFTRARSPPPSS